MEGNVDHIAVQFNILDAYGHDRVVNGVPGAKTAIIWAVFVSLSMSLLIIPMRGIGSSDRSLAMSVKSGRAESTKEIQRQRAERQAKQAEKSAK